jgi:hypothetical protein
MFKKLLSSALLAGSLMVGFAPASEGAVFVRRIGPVAPVARVATRVALPPYPVARRAVVGPVYGPVYGPVVYGSPMLYTPGVYVGYGF